MLNFTHPQTWQYDDIELLGTSWAGMATCLLWRQTGLVFDVGQGLPWAIPAEAYLITHGHQDHAGGIPYLISQRALHKLPQGRFFMPPSLVEPLQEIMDLWEQIEGHKYNFRFIPISPGEEVLIKPGLWLKPFPTVHRVPSQGYTVFSERKHLRPEFRGLPSQDIAELRRKKEVVEEKFKVPLLSFTGDTQSEFFKGPNWMLSAKVLVVEVTYFGKGKSVESAREWGHLHLDEFIENLDRLHCEHVLLMHFSSRYRSGQIHSELHKRLPKAWQGRVSVWPR